MLLSSGPSPPPPSPSLNTLGCHWEWENSSSGFPKCHHRNHHVNINIILVVLTIIFFSSRTAFISSANHMTLWPSSTRWDKIRQNRGWSKSTDAFQEQRVLETNNLHHELTSIRCVQQIQSQRRVPPKKDLRNSAFAKTKRPYYLNLLCTTHS